MISINTIIDDNPVEILSNGTGTVWINSAEGLIARFSLTGVDIHAAEIDGTHCLHCYSRQTNREAWEKFVEQVQLFYGIDLEQFPDIHPWNASASAQQ